MSYASELASITRKRIDLIEIITDYCENTYGSSPCTAALAAGSECYNTFKSCQDTANFGKTTKTYQFVNADLPLSIVNNYYGARPYLKSLGDLPTEIKETNTVVKRLKAEFYDEIDNDAAIDPYYATRASVQGTFWKKWLARNTNYKGRLIKQWEGFEGLATGDFSLKFVGKIENISINRGVVTVEATDLMMELSKIEYPLKTGVSLYEDLYKTWKCASETEMLSTGAITGDYAIRGEFSLISSVVLTSYQGGSGTLSDGNYYITFIGYDSSDRPYANWPEVAQYVDPGGAGYIEITWNDMADIEYYKFFIHDGDGVWIYLGSVLAGVETYIINNTSGTNILPPTSAEKLYLLTGNDPSTIGDWTSQAISVQLTIKTNKATDISVFDEPGYLKIDNEIIYYESIDTSDPGYDEFINCRFEQFDTDADWHIINTVVHSLLYKAANNPFTHLKAILTLADITASYIDTNFTTLESAWSGINFKTQPIVRNKLNEIYFDLVNAVDCISWVGEDGKVKIKEHSDRSGTIPTLTDTENFINDSISVDLNEESRYTRWLLYWNRFKSDGSITEEDNYTNLNIAIDATAESANEYNDEIEDIQTSTWINSDNDTPADVTAYVNALLAARKNRTRDAQTIIEAEIELKDTTLATGDLVYVNTSKIQNTDGTDYDTEMFRIVKKQMMGNKAKLKMIRIIPVPAQELATQQDQFITTQQDAEIYIQG